MVLNNEEKNVLPVIGGWVTPMFKNHYACLAKLTGNFTLNHEARARREIVSGPDSHGATGPLGNWFVLSLDSW